jgi:hypothetical protein
MFSIFDVIGNDNDYTFDERDYKLQVPPSPTKPNRELTAAQTAETQTQTQTKEYFSKPEPKISLENEIGKLLETLVIGLTGKSLEQQRELVVESVVDVSTKVSKSGDSLGERLANESEDYMIRRIVRAMNNDSSIEAMLWKLKKAKYAIGRFQDVLYDELRLRKGKGYDNDDNDNLE